MTIVEIIVAFSILMVGSVMLLPVGISSMQRAQQAQEQRQAWAHAIHLRRILTLQSSSRDGQEMGTFEDQFHYVIDYDTGVINVFWQGTDQEDHSINLYAANPH